MRKILTPAQKEQQQLLLCQRLIANKSYLSQEQIRRDLQSHGFEDISQSTVSRLLKILGVIKMQNAKGKKIYTLNPTQQPEPDAARSVAEMVLSVECNAEFIMVHTVAGYGSAVARVLDYRSLPEVLGVIAASNVVWIAPRDTRRIIQAHRRVMQTLGV